MSQGLVVFFLDIDKWNPGEGDVILNRWLSCDPVDLAVHLRDLGNKENNTRVMRQKALNGYSTYLRDFKMVNVKSSESWNLDIKGLQIDAIKCKVTTRKKIVTLI